MYFSIKNMMLVALSAGSITAMALPVAVRESVDANIAARTVEKEYGVNSVAVGPWDEAGDTVLLEIRASAAQL
ncbi:hypothetical protein F5Y16DRAFT_406800 [Xylariaceae sp. FL0255]|nr:hypothetical protein F5Y16DRAFT_406800 [Xylariaceae sp. FL0255]